MRDIEPPPSVDSFPKESYDGAGVGLSCQYRAIKPWVGGLLMNGKWRVGINGFGRIGRILFRHGFDRFEIVGVNNGSGTGEAQAHLLKYDSTHGRFGKEVAWAEDHLVVEGQKVPFSMTRDPEQIPWKEWGADIVFECTGVFKDREANQKHLEAGAKKVIVSAPAKVDATLVYGINHRDYKPTEHHVVSNASCTTNCLAPPSCGESLGMKTLESNQGP